MTEMTQEQRIARINTLTGRCRSLPFCAVAGGIFVIVPVCFPAFFGLHENWLFFCFSLVFLPFAISAGLYIRFHRERRALFGEYEYHRISGL